MSNYSERGKILHKCHICCKQFKQYDLELHFLSCNVEDDEDIKDEIQDEIQNEIQDEIQDEIRDEIRGEIRDKLQELKSNVEENTCKIGEVIPYINETISDTCIEKISKGEFCHT